MDGGGFGLVKRGGPPRSAFSLGRLTGLREERARRQIRIARVAWTQMAAGSPLNRDPRVRREQAGRRGWDWAGVTCWRARALLLLWSSSA